MRKTIQRAARRAGYDVRRAAPDVSDFLQSRGVDLVFDVGANVGQFGLELRSRGYKGRIVSFEPVSSAFAALKLAASGDAGWEVHNHALGSVKGTAQIKVSASSVLSSLLPQTPMAEVFDSEARIIREETVRVERLDALFNLRDKTKAFLKIDTQGFERSVLEGAEALLPHLLGLQTEFPTRHLYEGVWSLPEALDYLMRRGFILAQIKPTNFGVTDPASLIEVDCVFRRIDADA